jgi:hypothetical protein
MSSTRRRHREPSEPLPPFALVSVCDLRQAVLPLLHAQLLKRVDRAVLLGLLAHMNTRTGRSETSLQALGVEIGMHYIDIRDSFARLQRQGLATRCRVPGVGIEYRLSPAIALVGGEKRRKYQKESFALATAKPTPAAA